MNWKWEHIRKLKPQDSFGECNTFFFTFKMCSKSSESTIRPSCNCFESHIIMQYCPVVNYHYVHNLSQSFYGGGGGGGGAPIICMFWLFPENGSILERIVNWALKPQDSFGRFVKFFLDL